VAAALLLTGSALADQTYTDSSNEVAGSADISTVSVVNDPIAGTITFQVQTNMTTMEPNSEIDFFIDIDRNAGTGDQNGFEYIFGLAPDGWFFGKWDGTQFTNPGVHDLLVHHANGLVTFEMPVADLGSPASFDFAVITFRGPDANNPLVDQAPDTDVWTYTMLTAPPPPPPPPPPAPTVSTVSVVDAGVPHAGKVFRVSGLEVDLSNGVETKAKNLKCTATLAGKHLKGAGTGGCTFHLPKTAKGEKLSIKVTGTYKSTKLGKAQTLKVK
jgi:hypothetical protein